MGAGGCCVLLLITVAATLAQISPGPRRLNPFQEQLVAAWTLDETTGTRMDCWGTNDMTAVNAPVAVPGKIANAASWRTAASQYLTAVPSPEMNASNTSFTCAAWIFVSNSPPSYLGAFGCRSSASPYTNDQWAVDMISPTGLRVTYTIGAAANDTITNFTTLTNTWMLMFAWCDLNRNFIGGTLFTTNGMEWQERAKTVTTGRGCNFEIGCNRQASFWPGMIDDAAFWRRMLSTNEMRLLYNLGHGGMAYYLTKRR